MTAKNLLNQKLVEQLASIPFSNGHGAGKKELGLGLIYYFIPYTYRARTCVCLGSGGGFVPALMRQAQRDLQLSESRTFLVDAILPEKGFGGPCGTNGWQETTAFFQKNYPEIDIISSTTKEVGEKFFRKNPVKIDYLHVDADHSAEMVEQDIKTFWDLLKPSAIVSFHDSNLQSVEIGIRKGLEGKNFVQMIKLSEIGAGLTIIRKLEK